MTDWLFPPLCLGCGALLRAPRRPALCVRCRPTVSALSPDVATTEGVEACFAYQGALASALWRMKFRGDLSRVGPLADAMTGAAHLRRAWDAWVPVPLHWTRALRRGFNQATELARALAVIHPGAPPVRPRWLRRRRPGPPVHTLPAARRPAIVRDAFAVRDPARIAGRRILLVDDVTTTGATLRACKDALSRAGAAEIGALALLRAL